MIVIMLIMIQNTASLFQTNGKTYNFRSSTWRPLWAVWLCCLDTSWRRHHQGMLSRKPMVQHLPKEREKFWLYLAVNSMVNWVSVCMDDGCMYVYLIHTHLDTDAALQFELQADHIDISGCTESFQLRHFTTHFIYSHLYRTQVCMVLIHHCYTLFHVGKTVSGWRKE